MGSFGQLYEALLLRNLQLAASATSPIDLDAKQQFLSVLAFNVSGSTDRSFSEAELDQCFTEYCDEFHVSYPRAKLEKELLKSGIIRKQHGRFEFKYKYAFYFFVRTVSARIVSRARRRGRRYWT